MFTICDLQKDEFGGWVCGPARDVESVEEYALLNIVTDWSGATDLPDGVKFQDAIRPDGQRVRVFSDDFSG